MTASIEEGAGSVDSTAMDHDPGRTCFLDSRNDAIRGQAGSRANPSSDGDGRLGTDGRTAGDRTRPPQGATTDAYVRTRPWNAGNRRTE